MPGGGAVADTEVARPGACGVRTGCGKLQV